MRLPRSFLSPIVIVVLLSLGFVVALGAAPVHASSPSISLSPPSGPSGIVVHVSGSGFAPSSSSIAYFDGVPETGCSGCIDSSGTLAQSLVVPNSQILGPHTISVTDGAGNTGSATYTVTIGTSVPEFPVQSGTLIVSATMLALLLLLRRSRSPIRSAAIG
jgi:hypothetical protein